MLLLLFALPFWGLEFVVIPAIIWEVAAPRWHIMLALLYASCLLVLLMLWLRHHLREVAEESASAAPRGSHKWAARSPPEKYRFQLTLYLRSHGWRIPPGIPGERGRVEIIAKKDRYCVALLCAGPRQHAVDHADLDRLAAIRRESGASHAALVGTAAFSDAIRRAAARLNLRLLRFDDLAQFEISLGMFS